jgi:sulfide:quinone oxidoreductase
MHPPIVILGGGFGGLTVATRIRAALPAERQVIVIDRDPTFSAGFRKLWQLVGYGNPADGMRDRSILERQGIEFRQEEVRSIDPEGRAVVTDSGELAAEFLVVALGAEPRPDLVPGLIEHGHDVWKRSEVPAAAQALRSLERGHVLIAVTGAPYTCPPAPFECAFHVDEALRERGIRDQVTVEVATIQPVLMPNAGPENSAIVAARLEQQGIATRAGLSIDRIEEGRVVLADGEIAFDLLLGVPPHRPPSVVAQSPLAGPSGFIHADRHTFETAFDGVFAVGDCVQVPLSTGMPLPRAGSIADAEGKVVADRIIARVRGEAPDAEFDGRAECFIEMGTTSAAAIAAEWYREPAPLAVMQPESADNSRAKHDFEHEMFAQWFGE